MGTVNKRPSGGYQAQVCIAGVRKSKTFLKLSEAKRWIAQLESDHDNGVTPESRLLLRDLLQEFKEEKISVKRRPRHESSVVSCLMRDPIGAIPIGQVKPQDVEDWIQRRRTIPSENTGRLVTEATILRTLTTMSSFFTWVVKRGIISENPCHKVQKPKDSEPRERIATDEEIEAIKFVSGYEEGVPPATVTARIGAAFVLACVTGMRAGEMMRIERSWIQGKTLKLPADATKTRTGRTIALSSRARQILDDVCALELGPTIWELSDGVRDALWRKIRDKAGLHEVRDSEGRIIKQGLNFHDGRATFCTWAASPGPDGSPRLDVLSLARQTGHKNMKMLMRYYRPNVESFADRLEA